MKRKILSRTSHKQKQKWGARRNMAVEALEAKQLLAGDAPVFGFLDVPGGFAFQIIGTNFADTINIGTTLSGGFATNFSIEYTDGEGNVQKLADSISAGDIANEATQRGFVESDFQGFFVKGCAGDDTILADGSGSITNDSTTTDFDPFIGPHILKIDAGADNDTIEGSPGNDVILTGSASGKAPKDVADGNGGNDTIMGGNGNDDLTGGTGEDDIDGGEGNDVIFGDEGDDNLSGEGGNDTLWGGKGGDELEGGAGDDDLIGDPLTGPGDRGADKLSGGDGDDILVGDNTDKDPEGGDGTDAFQAGPTTTGLDSKGDPGGDLGFDMTVDDIEKIDTTGNNEDLNPRPQDGKRFGDQKDPGKRDSPYGPFGPFDLDDTVDSSGWTTDSVDGVHIITGGGDDTIEGSDVGKDTLEGGDDDDSLDGNGGNDKLFGQDGDDTLRGGAGADTLDGGDGNDTATYSDSPAAVDVDLITARGKDGVDTNIGKGFGGDAEGDRINRVGEDDGDKTTLDSTIENLIGSEFDDELEGDTDENKIEGLGGDDTIRGGGGKDNLFGGDGNDSIDGDRFDDHGGANDDKDSLAGGKGDDTLLGGTGDHRDLLEGNSGNDDLDGEGGEDGVTGGKGDDVLRMIFRDDETIDDIFRPFGSYGDEGGDLFFVTGADTPRKRLVARNDLISGETEGRTDYDPNSGDTTNLSD